MYFTIPTILALISSTISIINAAFIPQGGIESADFVLVAPSPNNTPSSRSRSHSRLITKKLSKADCKQMDQHLSEISKAIMVLQQHNNSTKNIDYDSEEVQDMYKMFIPLVSADENKGGDFDGSNNIPIVISAHETYQSTPAAAQSDDNPLLLLAQLQQLQQLQQQPQQQPQQHFSGKEAVILEGIKDIKTNQQFERIERLINEREAAAANTSSSSPPPPAQKQCLQCQKAKKAKKTSSGSSNSNTSEKPSKSSQKSASKTASTATSTTTSNPTDNISAAKTLVY